MSQTHHKMHCLARILRQFRGFEGLGPKNIVIYETSTATLTPMLTGDVVHVVFWGVNG